MKKSNMPGLGMSGNAKGAMTRESIRAGKSFQVKVNVQIDVKIRQIGYTR